VIFKEREMNEVWRCEKGGTLAHIVRNMPPECFEKRPTTLFLINGKVKAKYEAINDAILSPDGKHWFLSVQHGKQNFVVIDGVEQPVYNCIHKMVLSPDGRILAYCARKENGKKCVVLNGVEGKEYDGVLGLKFSRSNKLAYRAMKNSELCVVIDTEEERWYDWVSCFEWYGNHYVYLARIGDHQCVVLDGTELGWYQEITEVNFEVTLRLVYKYKDQESEDFVRKDIETKIVHEDEP